MINTKNRGGKVTTKYEETMKNNSIRWLGVMWRKNSKINARQSRGGKHVERRMV